MPRMGGWLLGLVALPCAAPATRSVAARNDGRRVGSSLPGAWPLSVVTVAGQLSNDKMLRARCCEACGLNTECAGWNGFRAEDGLMGSCQLWGASKLVSLPRAARSRNVSLIWDTDLSGAITTPVGIVRGPAGPRGFNGRAVNIYGNNGAFPRIASDGTLVNGGVPQRGNLSLHLTKLARDLAALVPNQSFVGHCLVDYEQWRADWNSTGDMYRELSLNLTAGQAREAQAQYEAAAKTWFLATIATVRRVRPGCTIGWYGYPPNALPHSITPAWARYCKAHPDRCWFDRGGRSDRSGYLGTGGDAARASNDRLGWLFAALDVITPSVYLGIASAAANGNTSAYVASTVREAVRLAAGVGGRPVFAVVWHHYDDYWRVPPPAPRDLLTPSDLRAELVGPLANGADGVLIWGNVAQGAAASNPQSAAALQTYANGTLAEVTAAICRGGRFECTGMGAPRQTFVVAANDSSCDAESRFATAAW